MTEVEMQNFYDEHEYGKETRHVVTFENVCKHRGHKIEVNVLNGTAMLECATCSETIMEVSEGRGPEIIVELIDGVFQDVYSTMPLQVTRVDWDKYTEEKCLVEQLDSSGIEDFQPEGEDYQRFAKNVLARYGLEELERLNALTGHEPEEIDVFLEAASDLLFRVQTELERATAAGEKATVCSSELEPAARDMLIQAIDEFCVRLKSRRQ